MLTMNRSFPMIAAAVAAAIGSGYANAVVPTLSQAAAPTVSLNIAGSSAAAAGVSTAIQTTLCGGAANTLISSSHGGSGNFLANSCFTATAVSGSPGIPAGTLVTIYYRTEGGSVVGALPIASGKQIKRLNLADTTDCVQTGNTVSCTVNGTTSTSGTLDTWTGAVTNDTVQLGVTDVEPGQLTNADYPSNYSVAAFGAATPAQLKALPTTKLYQQVFGLAVNKSGQTFTTVNLTKESAANILSGNYSDWANVPDALTGNPISSAASAITRVNREPGSGTRTSANIYFLNYQCGSTANIQGTPGEVLNFSTGDELTFANSHPGSIAYTSIDQILNPANGTKFTNLVLATINGVPPTTLAAATGQYDYWFEATLVPNSAVGTNTQTGNLSSFLQAQLPKLATAPAIPDVNVIPNVAGNTATVPLTSNGKAGTQTVYINPYTRNGNSCNVPSETN
jgi:hypothetical protein